MMGILGGSEALGCQSGVRALKGSVISDIETPIETELLISTVLQIPLDKPEEMIDLLAAAQVFDEPFVLFPFGQSHADLRVSE